MYKFKLNFKIDTTKLIKSPLKSLFKYRKEGLILKINYITINLSELFEKDPYECLDILERLLDEDFDVWTLSQIKEILIDFRELYKESTF